MAQYLTQYVEPLVNALIDQMNYPELYKLSKFVTDEQRPYEDMTEVITWTREDWEAHKYHYPSEFTDALVELETYYEGTMTLNPDTQGGHPYYDPRFILFFSIIVHRQKEFSQQFLNAYIERTKGHQETMYNPLYDSEQADGVTYATLKVARSLWSKQP